MRRPRILPLRVGVVLVAAALCTGTAVTATTAPQPTTPPGTSEPYAARRILVGFAANATADAKRQARAAAGATSTRALGPNAEVLELTATADVPTAIAHIAGRPGVRYAEPDYIVQATATSDDPYFTGNSLWGMYGDASSPANAFGSQAAEAWAANSTGSRNVFIGVIDEGIDASHPDLGANVWTNLAEPIDGIDNDGNGYVDDRRGWDFYSKDNTTYDGTSDDHGTHVAGTMGALGGNGTGVAGVNWQVTMIPAKFLGPNGGYISDAVLALNYLVNLKQQKGLNIIASSNSWGGGGFSQSMLDAINRAGDAGLLFVAAAGNGGSDGIGDNNDTTTNYPSNYQCITRFDTKAARGFDCVVAVASITSSGAKSGFSNYGAITVDLGAPGSSVMSTLPNNSYGSYSGTSMATPHVSGAIALCEAANPALSASDIRSLLLSTVAPTTSLASRTVSNGRLDAGALVNACASGTSTPVAPTLTPPAPFGKSAPADNATGLGTNVKMSWQTSAGATSYEVCADTTNDNVCATAWKNVGTALNATVRVSTKSTYFWQVRAINADGTTAADAGTWWRFSTR